MMDNSKSKELFKRAQQIIPGGVNSPVRAFKSIGGTPPFISKAKGANIWDVDGNRYIDFVGSWGPMILGHADPDIIEAVKRALNDGTSFGATTDKELTLTEMIIDRVNNCEMVRLVNSGTEATMSAIRLARGITEKNKIIKFSGCYHGHGDSFLIEAGSGALTLSEPNSLGITNGTAQDTLIAEFNDIQSVVNHFDRCSEDIAAVIVEPVNGNTGCIPPQGKFLQELRSLCTKYQAMLIFDEVITGFRISMGGAAEYYDVNPDLFTFGKVIGGGFPIGAYAGKKEFMEFVSPAGAVYQAGTLSGNPIAVTAGIETLNKLTYENYTILEELANYFEENLQSIIDKHDYPVCQNRVGSIFTLFFHSGPIRNTKDVSECDFEAFKIFFHFLLDDGIYIAPSQFEAGFISLSHTRDILDIALDKIKIALKKIYLNAEMRI